MKLKSLVLVLIIVFSRFMCIYAAENKCTIAELGMEITFPDNYFVITDRELLTKSESKDTYLLATTNDVNEQIVVTMSKTVISDFNTMDDSLIISSIQQLITQNNMTLSLDPKIYNHPQTKFVTFQFSNTSFQSIVYGTIHDYKSIYVAYRNMTGNITEEQKEALKAIVDTIVFTDSDAKAAESPAKESTASSVYKDTKTGLTIDLPESWQQEELSAKREFVDAKFVSDKSDISVITYGSNKWAEDFENKNKFAKSLGISPSKLSDVVYNGVLYYQLDGSDISEISETASSFNTTVLMHAENGWLYSFQYMGLSENAAELDEFMNSVKYPGSSADKAAGTQNIDSVKTPDSKDKTKPETKKSKNDSEDASGITPTLIILIGIVLLMAVFILLYVIKYLRSKKEESFENPYDYFPPDDNNG
ncbi:MAG: hypothetical protein J5590_00550 [Clostridia bacterium]|nr:hypothetical protein [Clostridia bacterium]